jgi:hypothetical protein
MDLSNLHQRVRNRNKQHRQAAYPNRRSARKKRAFSSTIDNIEPSMYAHVVTKDPTEVEVEVQAAYLAMFPDGDRLYIPQIFGWVIDCFSGRYPGYQAIDAKYHDFEHTLQGALCMARLLLARHRANAEPRITRKMFELGIMAILLHDTGYLKKNGDHGGTGAKYTVVHVRRSADFAAEMLHGKGYAKEDIHAVQDMILCTGVNAALDKIPFRTDLEKMVGFALGTADLLGQMAADDYVEKLPVLYSEFAEASRHEGGKNPSVNLFTSEDDLMKKTPAFWEKYVRQKLETDFEGLYRYMNNPYPSGSNYYVEKVEANIARLRRKLADDAAPVPA